MKLKTLPIKPVEEIYKIGTQTQWGEIKGIGFVEMERTYFIVGKDDSVALMPHSVVRDSFIPMKQYEQTA